VIVGHGPSILSGLGAVIDSMTVVRLKDARTNRRDFGVRTDYICARIPTCERQGVPFWYFPETGGIADKWLEVFHSFRPSIAFKPRIPKPSTGMCALFCAMEYLKPAEISLIGFDAWFGHSTLKWSERAAPAKPHDWATELRVAQSLTCITNLAREYGQVSRL
jgi:hypothetical protein